MRTRSVVGWSTIVFLSAATFASPGVAQNYPTKPVRLLVGYVPGGAVDFTARLVGMKLSDLIGQSVVVENRAGAATVIATDRVAKASPDGYTLLLMPISTAVQSALRSNLPYDLLRDIAPVSLASVGPFVLAVHPSLPARSVKQLIALARAQPGALNWGSPGVGSANHLVGELFSMMTKVKMVHVPYKGSGEAVIAAASGQAPVTFSSVAGALPLLQTHKLVALAVTSPQRASTLPKVPTLDESGLAGFDYSAWYGLAAPAAVPKDIIARLNGEMVKIVQMHDVKEAFARQGFEARSSTPEEFGTLIRREIEQTVKLIKLTGMKVE